MKARAWLAALVASVACGRPTPATPRSEAATVVDLHVDLGDAIHHRGATLASPDLDANEERLVRGGVTALVVPLFVPEAEQLAASDVLAEYDAIWLDVERARRSSSWRGEIVYAFEGADGFVDEPSALVRFAARGACLVGLVHRRTNALAGASQEPSSQERARGLTDVGERVARAAVAAGMVLDVAHASDAAFDAIAAIAEAAGRPFVDSHTGVRALVPIDRNLDDARIARVARSGGLVAIDLHGGHVSHAAGEPPTLDDVADHVMHALTVAGDRHVAIGSDLAGNIESPTVHGVSGAAIFPLLRAHLAARGVSAATLDRVFAANARELLAGCPRRR